jgi:thiamine pyrophosphokinase
LFANGEINDLQGAEALIQPDDLLIAADGGARHCQLLGLTPSVIIGDLDSLMAEEVTAWKQAGVEILRYNTDKDETDLELALLHARRQDIQEVVVLGGLGRRWDQTLVNLMLPAYTRLRGLQIVYWENGEWLYFVDAEIEIEGEAGCKVSLIPIGGDAQGVTTEGLRWPLVGETLYFGASRGVSNLMTGEAAKITVDGGVLLVVVGSGE